MTEEAAASGGRGTAGGWLARWRRPRLPVWFDTSYGFALPASPLDPLRGEKVLVALRLARLLKPGAVTAPEPATLRALLRVHDDAYLSSLSDTAAASRAFGMAITPTQRDRAIAVQRAMAGGTLAAARQAVASSGIVCNLGGGLHHAHRDRCGGFCLFNDVAVAIAALRDDGFAEPVLVVDLDLHDGDGTRSLFADDPTVYTYSLHNRHWGDPEAVASTAIELGSGLDDSRYLDALRSTLPPVVAAHRPGLVVYLAGCDPAADDKLGDWKITATGMLERDRFVHDLVRGAGTRRKPPLVVLLAGGYGEQAWRPSARFLGWLLTGGRRAPALPNDEDVLLARYRALAQLFSPAELTGSGDGAADADDWGLTEEDLGGGLGRDALDPRLLGYYSPHGVELVLETTGIFDRLRDLGYRRPQLELDLGGGGGAGQTVRIWGAPRRRDLLAEVRLRRDRHTLPGFDLLAVEWLLLQNPRARFTAHRPPLPGQRYPGLGMLNDIMALLVQVCHRLHLDGLTFTPSHYHLATQSSRYLGFLDATDARLFAALREALAALPIGEATRSIEEGAVVDATTGEPYRWRPLPMLLAISDRLREQVDAQREATAAGADAATAPRFRLLAR